MISRIMRMRKITGMNITERKMKMKLLIFLVLALAVFGLAGCGTPSDGNNPSGGKNPSGIDKALEKAAGVLTEMLQA